MTKSQHNPSGLVPPCSKGSGPGRHMAFLVNYLRVAWLKLNLYLLPYIRSLCSRIIAGLVAAAALLMADFSGAAIEVVKDEYKATAHLINKQQMVQIAAVATHRGSSNLLAIAILGIILGTMPREQPWIFRMVLASGFVLGYFGSRLPPLRIHHDPTTINLTINHNLAASLTANFQVIPVIFVTILCSSFILLSLSRHLIWPKRSQNAAGFGAIVIPLSAVRRLAVLIISPATFVAAFYLAVTMRTAAGQSALNIGRNYAHNTDLWLLAFLAILLVGCLPRPSRHLNLFMASLAAIPALIAWLPISNTLIPHVIQVENAFWIAAWGYAIVVGFGFTCTANFLRQAGYLWLG